jgi:4-amino-4-deoxy-L-arabinose transferase-like glycosyltransferase
VTGRATSAAHDRALLLLAFAWLAATAWVRPLALPDEGRYVSVAWEMIRSGDWLVPTLDGLPYFHKPPLFYWLTAAALSVSDSTRLAARIAPWAGACLACASLFLFARRWAGAQVARASLLALATAPLFYFAAQYANLDMLVAGCITATVLAFAHAALLDPQGPGRKQALLLAWALCALGVLAKGLIGIVLPGMVLFLWLAWERRWMAMLRLLWPPGIVLFLLIAGPWFVLMQQRFEGFAHYFFIVQHFQRYSQATFNNPQPFWFYPAVLLVLSAPWTLWLLGSGALQWRGDSQAATLRRLMFVWLASITLFFSLPHSKLVGYILPVVAPMLFLAADAGLALRRERWWKASPVVAVAICFVALVAITMKANRTQAEFGAILRERLQPGDTVIALEDYRFAIPFEARLRRPMLVVSDWSPQAVASRDNWRKELADAAVFEPRQDWLITRAQLPARLCASSTAWLIGTDDLPEQYAWLAQAERVATSRRVVLWRVDAASAVRPALCRGTPSASSGDKS